MQRRIRGGSGAGGRAPRIGRSSPSSYPRRGGPETPSDYTDLDDRLVHRRAVRRAGGRSSGSRSWESSAAGESRSSRRSSRPRLGVALGLVLADVEEAVAGGLGGLLGAFGSTQLVRGALVRGGTRAATAFFVLLGAVVVALLALVPGLGYLDSDRGACARDAPTPPRGQAVRGSPHARPRLAVGDEEARPDRHRRPHAGHARARR